VVESRLARVKKRIFQWMVTVAVPGLLPMLASVVAMLASVVAMLVNRAWLAMLRGGVGLRLVVLRERDNGQAEKENKTKNVAAHRNHILWPCGPFFEKRCKGRYSGLFSKSSIWFFSSIKSLFSSFLAQLIGAGVGHGKVVQIKYWQVGK
jgi:hypothetical protein